VRDAVRLALGTLSVFPAGHPTTVDRRTWGTALTLAPVVGAVLGGLTSVVAVGVTEAGDASLLGAVVGVGCFALLTGGLHLDGLADVADGLGSRKPPDEARAVMKRSDIGPSGVVTLTLVLLVQVAALAQLLATSRHDVTVVTVIGAAVISRAALTWTCRRGVPAATAEGLGGQAAESLSVVAASAVVAVSFALVVGAAAVTAPDRAVTLAVTMGGLVALLAAELWRRHCSHRFGGVTGDVLGSVEQVAFTIFVVTVALLAQ
jgi:adenosylcobinamide-GDP ribazoletransferase